MIEATLVLPVAILFMAILCSIIINYYLSVSILSAVDLALREEAGERSQTIHLTRESVSPRSEKIRTLKDQIQHASDFSLYPSLTLSADHPYRGFLIPDNWERVEMGEIHIYDEAEFIRIAQHK